MMYCSAMGKGLPKWVGKMDTPLTSGPGNWTGRGGALPGGAAKPKVTSIEKRLLASEKANKASRQISEKPPEQRTKDDHDRAAELHAKAATMHEVAGDESRASYHTSMATTHSAKGSGSIGDQPRDSQGRFTGK